MYVIVGGRRHEYLGHLRSVIVSQDFFFALWRRMATKLLCNGQQKDAWPKVLKPRTALE
jgi:hypothetical protein